IENGISQPSAALFLRMADFFGVDVNQLMRDELEVE
ncbi:MAG: transcriptional regulator, partial [Anaerolineaceae bacterium 4572_78]